MSLFKRPRKFEEKLHEQLGDMEVKPSSSLWDRIDSGITSDSFEHVVQDSLENFEQMPYPETWDNIAAELPEPKVGNGLRNYYIGASLAVLFSVGLYIGQNWQTETIQPREEQTLQPNGQEQLTEQMLALRHASKQPQTAAIPKQEKLKGEVNRKESIPKTNRIVYSEPENLQHSPQPLLASTPKVQLVAQPIEPANRKINQSNTQPIVAKVDEQSHTPQLALAAKMEPAPKVKENNQTIANQEPVLAVTPTNTTTDNLMVAVAAPELMTGEPKEMLPVQPDSALYAQKVQAYQVQPQGDGLTKFSISVYAGVHLSFTTYGAPKQSSTLDFDKNINLRKELERPVADWSGGFVLDYRVGRKWMFSTGIMMVNFSQQFDYAIEKALDPITKNEVGAAVSNPSDSFVVGNQYSNRIKYSWTEIPVFVNYNLLQKNKWNIDLQGGVSYAFVNTIDGGMIGYDNKGVLLLRGKESFPNIQNTFFVSLMPQLSYQCSPTVSLGAAPSVKYSLTSIIGNEYWIQQHPYFVGMNICLRKRF
jgi:hypothetical protein